MSFDLLCLRVWDSRPRGAFARLACEALAECVERAVERRAFSGGTRVLVDEKRRSVSLAADLHVCVFDQLKKLRECGHDLREGREKLNVLSQLLHVEGAREDVRVLRGDRERLLDEAAALIAHLRKRLPLFGREVYEEGEFGAYGVDGVEDGLPVGLRESRADAVVSH